jgi:hypothetical protein
MGGFLIELSFELMRAVFEGAFEMAAPTAREVSPFACLQGAMSRKRDVGAFRPSYANARTAPTPAGARSCVTLSYLYHLNV